MSTVIRGHLSVFFSMPWFSLYSSHLSSRSLLRTVSISQSDFPEARSILACSKYCLCSGMTWSSNLGQRGASRMSALSRLAKPSLSAGGAEAAAPTAALPGSKTQRPWYWPVPKSLLLTKAGRHSVDSPSPAWRYLAQPKQRSLSLVSWKPLLFRSSSKILYLRFMVLYASVASTTRRSCACLRPKPNCGYCAKDRAGSRGCQLEGSFQASL
mmetsp:Transcript_270/g.858  ORF Transcript_270/g.858 Transcript_270/m.858 type:complete len:212 (-) Transcript_270:589-1224(-)